MQAVASKTPLTIDGRPVNANSGDNLVDVISCTGKEIPHVCYHPQLGPIET